MLDNMVYIEPLSEYDFQSSLRHFLSREFETQRLGIRGQFAGNSSGPLVLANLSASEIETLIHGRAILERPEGVHRAQDIAAWGLSFSCSQQLSFLHAVAPDLDARNIRDAQLQAALCVLRETTNCWANARRGRGWMGMLLDNMPGDSASLSASAAKAQANQFTFVVFNSAASQDQSPRLQTVAFLLNRRSHLGSAVGTLVDGKDIGKIMSPLKEAYAGSLDFFVWRAIGHFNRVPNVNELRIVGIPQEAVQTFFSRPRLTNVQAGGVNGTCVPEKELFAKWRSEAQKAGWGPKEAQELLGWQKEDRLWLDLTSKSPFTVLHPSELLRKAMASLRHALGVAKTCGQQKREQVKDRGQSHSH